LQPCSAQGEFLGFNYPIGSRNPGFVTENPDADGWFNYDFKTHDDDPRTDGFHSGEDWNDDCAGTTDVGAQVYAVADGEVIGVRDYIGASGKSLGDVLIIKYPVSPDESVYSLYLHIDSSLKDGDSVKRDQQIGTIADISPAGLFPHLHFELRTKPIDIDKLWPSDDDTRPNNAYYNDSKNDTGEVIETYSQKMDKDGLIDPSKFIDSHRPLSSSFQRGRIPNDFLFQRDLPETMCRYEVRYLQILLNHDPDTKVADVELAGSIGNEISTFGPATKQALEKFQTKYMSWDDTNPAWGIANNETRAKLNEVLKDFRTHPNVDVVFLIDSSGSMTSNDPDNARLDAVRAYLTGSLAGDFVGIVDFDSSARLAAELQELPDAKDNLINAIETIDSSGGTNIGIGIQEACDALIDSSSIHNFSKAAVLLTDGQGGYSDTKKCFEKRRWPIYTFGLGNGVNDIELKTIASDTGGEYMQLPANSLSCEFQRFRAKIAGSEPPECNQFEIFQSETKNFIVTITERLLQITFQIDWGGSDIITTLTTPSGRVIDMNTVARDVAHDKGATFEVFTITNPEIGDWNIELYGADIPDGGEEATFGFVPVPSSVTVVNIDIKPESDFNPINIKAKGVIPVAIFTTSLADGDLLDFNAFDVDPSSVSLGIEANEAKTEAYSSINHAEDVDQDGDLDLIVHFRIQETGIMCGDNKMVLTGKTLSGQEIEGSDSIRVVGCN
jgi:hypothetical protein